MSAAALLIVLTAALGVEREGPGIAQGPFVGHVTSETAVIWARVTDAGQGNSVDLVLATGGSAARRVSAVPDAKRDHCVLWSVSGLRPNTTYRYSIVGPSATLAAGESYRFTTGPRNEDRARVAIAFGSCAREDQGTSEVWKRIGVVAPDAVVLLGDTPYIDSTDLATQRRRYQEFASVPALRALLCHTPIYAVWDDHDFGRNDANGNMPGKENSWRAFVEYHANPSYGDGSHGVYTRFRRGPIEVFLLDTRYFARTEPSPANPKKRTLLGVGQWQWLKRELKASTAPFKVLAGGMIWNRAVREGKRDHWGTYRHERDALFRFIGENGISGVTLVAGDIHRSRVLRHRTVDLAGYELTELITSPMHGEVKASANVPHPGLIRDMGEPHSFLLLTADSTVEPATLEARFINAAGDVLYRVTLSAEELAE